MKATLFRDLRRRRSSVSGLEEPEFTLFLLHHAGGSSATFSQLRDHFPGTWRLRAVELPGRGTASKQRPFRDTAEAVNELAPALLSEVSGPYGIVGHSMGALIGFELVRELQRMERLPAWLGVSAMPEPGLVSSTFPDRRDLWSQERLVEFMRAMGGTPSEVLADPDFTQHLVEVLRADLRIVDTYAYTEGLPLKVPLTVYTGADDPLTVPHRIAGWRDYCTETVRFHSFPGGHFFLLDGQSEHFARQVTADVRTQAPLVST